MELCQKCLQPVNVGDFPFCPHGAPTLAVHPDDVPGGFVVENGFDEPTRFYSHTEHEKALEARGLKVYAKWAGDNDKIMTNWAGGVDAQTLSNAAALVQRGPQARREKAQRWKDASTPITVSDGDSFTGKDLA